MVLEGKALSAFGFSDYTWKSEIPQCVVESVMKSFFFSKTTGKHVGRCWKWQLSSLMESVLEWPMVDKVSLALLKCFVIFLKYSISMKSVHLQENQNSFPVLQKYCESPCTDEWQLWFLAVAWALSLSLL